MIEIVLDSGSSREDYQVHIKEVYIHNFKCFAGAFCIKFDDSVNIIVGDNECGKTTIIEAIHLALTGYYRNQHISRNLTEDLFNSYVVEEYLQGLRDKANPVPPSIGIEIVLGGRMRSLLHILGTVGVRRLKPRGSFVLSSWTLKHLKTNMKNTPNRKPLGACP